LTALGVAVRAGNLEIVRQLVETGGANVNDRFGNFTPLILAVRGIAHAFTSCIEEGWWRRLWRWRWGWRRRRWWWWRCDSLSIMIYRCSVERAYVAPVFFFCWYDRRPT
jgi:hypothetical protein